jgi:nucleoside-diphosphate-sugar epimerase
VTVRALALPGETVPDRWSDDPGLTVVRGDVTDPAAMDSAVAGAGTVIHLAAVVGDWGPRALFQRVSIGGTEHVLGAAAAVGAGAVLASSIVVYAEGIGRGRCTEETPHGRPLGPYSWAKQQQEIIGRRLAAERGLRLTIVRPANVYGPGSRPWVEMAAAHLRRGLPALLGREARVAGLVYVEHVAEVFYRAAGHLAEVAAVPEPPVYNAAEDSEVTWERYFRDLARLVGAAPPRHLPLPVARGLARVGEPLWRLLRLPGRPPMTREALNLAGSHHRISIERARQELGFEPWISYEEGLAAVAASLR